MTKGWVKRVNVAKICRYCESEFIAKQSNRVYCSDTCRYAWQARNQSEKTRLRRQVYQKKWGTENWTKRRNYMLQYSYGITPEQYEQLLVKQNHRCFICLKHETEFAKKLAVDHDHVTNEIIGLLCGQCNKDVIGKRRDPALFYRAAEYLRQHTGWFVPPKKKRKKRVLRSRK